MKYRIGALLCGVVLSAFAAGNTWAHAVLMKAAPESGAQLAVAPKELELAFNENVGPVFFKVLDRSGREVGAPAEIRIDGNSLFLPLGAPLEKGTYVVSYRVISADTHPVGGSFAFAIGEPVAASAATAGGGGATSAWALPTFVNRIVLYASVLLAAGSALLLLLLPWPEAARKTLRRQGRIAAIVAAIAFVAAFAFGGADIVAGGVGALFSGAAWSAAMKSTLALSALLGVPGALLAIFAFRRSASWALWSSLGLLIASFLVTGHAATAAPVWLAATNVALHLAGAGFWFAAFAPLRAATRSDVPGEAGRLMDQFSSRALWLVGALLLSGLVVSWIQVRSPVNLFTTDYGQRLAVKIALVLGVLALAAYNKFRLTPRLLQGAADAPALMARSIRIESVVMLLIVTLAASLTMATPPRALADQAAAGAGAAGGVANQGFRDTWISGKYKVEVEVTPAAAGENMVMLRFRNAAGEPVTMKSAGISAALPAAALEGIEKEGQAMPPDMYHFMFSELIIPGEWTFRVGAFIDDFDKIEFEGKVPVK